MILNSSIRIDVLAEFSHHRKWSDVGLAGTSWSANQHVFIRLRGSLVNFRLNSVECLESFKRLLGAGWELVDWIKRFKRPGFQWRYVNFFVSLAE